MLKTSSCNKKVALKNMQLPSYAVSTLSSQGKVKSMEPKSAVSEKNIIVPSTSMYKDNKIYKCPVCKGSLISEGIFNMVSSSKIFRNHYYQFFYVEGSDFAHVFFKDATKAPENLFLRLNHL